MHFAAGNTDECGNVAVQVEERMHLDRAFVLAEPGPWKQRKAQVNGGRVQRIQALVQFDADRIGDVKRPREVNQNLSEIGEDAPVMRVVSIGQGGARHLPVKAHVIELASERSQACLYVAQAIPVSKLGKAHRQVLIPTREASRSGISAVPSHATTKFAIGQKAQQLREDGSALVHALLSARPRLPVLRLAGLQIAATKIPAQLSAIMGLASHDVIISRTVVIRDSAADRIFSKSSRIQADSRVFSTKKPST
jgi:hypothetical protein